jgi:Flp pilus assembly protein TadD
MKKLSILIVLLHVSVCLKAQEPVAQVNQSSLFALPNANVTPLKHSDQLFSDATGLMFGGQNEEAFTLFKKAAESFKSEKRFHEWTGCFAGMAIVLSSEGRYHKFLRISKRALRVHNKFNALDLDAEETLRSNVGMGYRLVGNNKKADKYWPISTAAKN